MRRQHLVIPSIALVGWALASAAACGEDETDVASGNTVSGPTVSASSTGSATSSGGAGGMPSTGGNGGMPSGGNGGMPSGGNGGAGGGMMGSQKAYYWGDFDTDATVQVASVEWPPGTPSVLAPQGLTGGDAIRSVAVSPDGMQIAIAGRDMMGQSDVLNVYAADGMGAPTLIVDVATQTNDTAQIAEIAYSPDGMWLAYLADFDVAFGTAVYVSPANGSAPPKRVSQLPASGSNQVFSLAWLADSQNLVFTGDVLTNNVTGIWAVDTTATTPSAQELVPAGMLADMAEVLTDPQIDANGLAYFKSSHEGSIYLYRNDIAATNLEVVPGTDVLMNQNGQAEIGSFGLNASGTKLAFSADSPETDLYQVFVMDLASTTATVMSNITTTPPSSLLGPFFNAPIAWSAGDTQLAVHADWEEDNVFSAYILPTSGNPGGVRILQATGGLDVNRVAFTSGGQRVIVRGDLVTDGAIDIYATTDFVTADQAAATVRVEEALSVDSETFDFVIAP